MRLLLAYHPMRDILTHHQQEGMCIYFTWHLFINHPIFCRTRRYAFILHNQCLRKYRSTIFVMYIQLLICSLQTYCIDQHVDHNMLFLVSNVRFLPILVTTTLLPNVIDITKFNLLKIGMDEVGSSQWWRRPHADFQNVYISSSIKH